MVLVIPHGSLGSRDSSQFSWFSWLQVIFFISSSSYSSSGSQKRERQRVQAHIYQQYSSLVLDQVSVLRVDKFVVL